MDYVDKLTALRIDNDIEQSKITQLPNKKNLIG